MQRKPSVAVGFLFLFLLNVAANTMFGGSKESKVDENTIRVAEFAVTQLNGKANFPKQGTLKFGKVLSAKTQVGCLKWHSL